MAISMANGNGACEEDPHTPYALDARQIYSYIGVRGMPERDIESLGVMGRGLEAARRFFRRRRRHRRRRRPPKVGV